ncbi:ATP synthase F1 subunit gamma [Candidatus Roizmanbacteria bacterium]|nr:ATP synthase F1 subunit gamma [Candidatus Roizmanbacteria bacterium]
MANIIALLRRIRTAQNVSKTTRAMQMIAASKLKKAQEAALASRPYVNKLSLVTQGLTNRIEKASLPTYMTETAQTGKSLVIIIAPDKGLCGGLVTNLVKEVLRQKNNNNIYVTIGKKIESTVVYVGKELIASFPFGNTLPSFDVVYPITKMIDEYFLGGKVDKVEILSTHFASIFTQKPQWTKLLPILPHDGLTDAVTQNEAKQHAKSTNDHFALFEPDLETILPDLLKRYMEMVIYQEILESYLSEQAARMLSMQNATNNAKDIIEDLKLEYNKTRQAKITSELLDITGGLVA